MLDTIVTDLIGSLDMSLPKKPRLVYHISLQEASPVIFSCADLSIDQQSLWNLVVRIKCSDKKIKNLKLSLTVYSDDPNTNVSIAEIYKELSLEHEIIYRLNSPISSDDVISANKKITLILNYEYSYFFFKKIREEKSSWVTQTEGLNISTDLKRIS